MSYRHLKHTKIAKDSIKAMKTENPRPRTMAHGRGRSKMSQKNMIRGASNMKSLNAMMGVGDIG